MNILGKIEKFVACACTAVMALLVFGNVIARYVFNHSLAFSDEMSTYLFVLMSFMGTAIAARRHAHLGLTAVTDHLSPGMQKIFSIFGYAVASLFCLLILIYGVQMVISQYQLGQVTSAMQWPEWIYGSFVPIGAAFALLAFVDGIIHMIKDTEPEKEEET